MHHSSSGSVSRVLAGMKPLLKPAAAAAVSPCGWPRGPWPLAVPWREVKWP
jgi:hypothetical protein